MISDELKKIVDQLEKQGEMAFLDGATEEQITSFEKEHEIELPLQFKKWLLFSDGGEFFLPAVIQLYGVSHKPLIDVNDNEILGDEYIVIGALSNGDPVLVESGKETISIYNLDAERIEEDESYTDFFSFLDDLNDLLGIGE